MSIPREKSAERSNTQRTSGGPCRDGVMRCCNTVCVLPWFPLLLVITVCDTSVAHFPSGHFSFSMVLEQTALLYYLEETESKPVMNHSPIPGMFTSSINSTSAQWQSTHELGLCVCGALVCECVSVTQTPLQWLWEHESPVVPSCTILHLDTKGVSIHAGSCRKTLSENNNKSHSLLSRQWLPSAAWLPLSGGAVFRCISFIDRDFFFLILFIFPTLLSEEPAFILLRGSAGSGNDPPARKLKPKNVENFNWVHSVLLWLIPTETWYEVMNSPL